MDIGKDMLSQNLGGHMDYFRQPNIKKLTNVVYPWMIGGKK